MLASIEFAQYAAKRITNHFIGAIDASNISQQDKEDIMHRVQLLLQLDMMCPPDDMPPI